MRSPNRALGIGVCCVLACFEIGNARADCMVDATDGISKPKASPSQQKSGPSPPVSILRVKPADPTDQRTFAFVPIMPALKGQEELRTTGWTPAIPGQGELLTPGIDQTPNENQVAGWSVAGRFGDWKQIKITPEMQEYVTTQLPLGIAGLNAASSTEQFVLPWALGTRGTSC